MKCKPGDLNPIFFGRRVITDEIEAMDISVRNKFGLWATCVEI